MKPDHFNEMDCRDDYKFSEMIGQKPLMAILSLNLIRYSLERKINVLVGGHLVK